MSQITLHAYQIKAAFELTKQYPLYRQNPLFDHNLPIPYLKFLSSVTGSGKTAILVQTLANLLNHYSRVQPIIFWLSCNKVVVQQTLHNLKGKYQSLLPPLQVKSFLEISFSDITQLGQPLIYVDTIQKFSVQNKETRLIYQVQPDKGDLSPWQLIQDRQAFSIKRDLIIIYDEGHNLTDSQVEKILELQPQALFLASGTPSLPHSLTNYKKILETNNFLPLYSVPFKEVKDQNMVKGKLVLGGYQSQMEEVLNEMLDKDWKMLCSATLKEDLSLPKIIYVCKTNLLAGKGGKRDNPQVPFNQRNAPPILIWRHLVEQKKIDPSTIAVYADISVAKEERYALEWKFTQNLFNKGKSSPKENTYEKFIKGNYQHIIFNRSLAEGWDDPLIYLAYIDKTIGSEIAVEQIIGRVLRQPNCRYYSHEELNKAYFHIRLDENKVFKKIIEELNEKLAIPAEDLEIRDKTGGMPYLIDIPAKKAGKLVPKLTWDSEYIQRKLQRIVNNVPNYAKDFPLEYRQNIGKVQRSEYGFGDPNLIQPSIWEEDFGLTNMVPAQVILRRTIIEKNTKVWNMLEWEDSKFRIEIGWGSKADEELRKVGEELVQTYLTESILKVSLEKPYEVRGIKVERNKKRQHHFKNALHEKYSQLNNLELRTATVLDNLGIDWCRNPTHYGYGIDLLDEIGLTQTFFPDFLLWVGDRVVCLEVTGEHLERDKLERKLVRIAEPGEEMIEEGPKKVKVIILIQYGNPKENQEIYYKVWYRVRRSGEAKSIRVESISEGLEVILSDL